jgi:hypothetical protein
MCSIDRYLNIIKFSGHLRDGFAVLSVESHATGY